MALALKFSGVLKKFGKCRALDGFNLEVPYGSAMGLVGSNGAGKTTSFAVASGLVRADAGEVNLFGEGEFSPEKHSGRVTVMPQDTNFPPYARVRELLEYFADLQGIDGPGISRSVEKVLDWVHLKDRADSEIRTLSHGMRRRVVIAQAFLGEPELVMLDEPTSGLDPREVVSIRRLLKDRPGRQTVIISSHNLHEIERICDHVAFIRKGRLVRQAAMDEVTGRHSVVQYLVASTKEIDTAQLAQRLPDADLQIVDAVTLTCGYDADVRTLEAVNASVLGYLIEKGVPVSEVKRGGDLESVYMGDSSL